MGVPQAFRNAARRLRANGPPEKPASLKTPPGLPLCFVGIERTGDHMIEAEFTTDQRRSRRLSLALPARCRMLSGYTDDVVIRDLAPEGCRIASTSLCVRPGNRIVLRPQGLEGICGLVIWARGEEAGVCFEQALYLPVVEHLHRTWAHFIPPHRPWCASGPRKLAA